jgi:hypothetical protein
MPRKTLNKPKRVSLWKNYARSKPHLVIFVVIFAVIGSYLLIKSFAAPSNVVVPFREDSVRGLRWAGLKTPHTGSKCAAKLFEATDSHGKSQACTHGPDPAPPGVDVRQSVTPVRTGENDVTAADTAATATSSVGGELLAGCSGTNWSSNGYGVYKHVSGSAAPLTCTITGGVTPGATYQVFFASQPSSSNSVTPAIGDTKGLATYGTMGQVNNIGATTTSNPTFTPSSATDVGTISSISIKLVSAVNTIPCDGDGTSGPRIQALYVHASDVPDRSAAFATSFQIWANNTNNVFIGSSSQTGAPKSLRWVQDANCKVIVNDVTLSPTGDDNFGNTVQELLNQGYTRKDRKYLLWVDANVYCGLSGIVNDDQPGPANLNNSSGTFSRVDNGCWGSYSSPEAHELGHALGAVQSSAPHTTGGYHCSDENDLMCYQDSSTVVLTYPCPSASSSLLDCNHDDYFNVNPPAGSYLATHWNVANSVFLFNAPTPPPPPPPDTPTPPPGDTTGPSVTITSPNNGIKISRKTIVKASATDNVGVVKMELYIDSVLKATSTTGSISYTWICTLANRGSHTVTVKAYDAAGNFGLSSAAVTR